MSDGTIADPWHLGGYAPGCYSNLCRSCKAIFVGDKRAFQCLPCAVRAANADAEAAALRAQGALREVPEVTEAMLDAFYTSNPTNHTLPPRHWVRSALTAALAAAPQPEDPRP